MGTLLDAIHALCVHHGGIAYGPVDPHDLNDFGPPPQAQEYAIDPQWFLGRGALQAVTAVDESSYRPLSKRWPIFHARVDLSFPDTAIMEQLRRYRREAGVRPSRRPSREADWDQIAPAYEMLLESERRPQAKPMELAARFLGARVDDPDADSYERQVRRLLARSRAVVEEMSAAHEAARNSPITPPPRLVDHPDK